MTLEAAHPEARHGIAQVAAGLIRFAEEAIQRGEWGQAEAHLAKAASINPDATRLAEVWWALDAHRAETEKQARLAQQEEERHQAEQGPNDPLDEARRAMNQGKSIQGLIDDALRAMERANWSNAQNYLDQASALDPRNEDISLLLDELTSRRAQAGIKPGDKTTRAESARANALVHIQKASSSVAKARPGETVEFFTEYAMSTPVGQKYEYVEVTWVLKRHGRKVGDEGMSASVVKPGVNSVSNHLTLPARVTPGRYEVEHRVRAGDSVDIATSGFLVMTH